MKPPRLAPGRRRRQRGSYVVMFALMLTPLILLGGMAIDMSMAFKRRTDLQSAVDAAALAAARALDGTAAGIDNADLRAAAIINASFFGFTRMSWSSAALRFSDSPDRNGNWLPANAAGSGANVSRMRYARVDTAGLDSVYGIVRTVFAGAIDGAYATLNVNASAVAGRSQVQVTPLAICALDQQRFGAHNTPDGTLEWIEHGFRRGVNYNLLNLNPVGTAPLHFQVNPVDFPPATESASNRALDALRPMVCSGSMALPFLPDNTSVYVRQDFPSSLASELNSRFGSVAGCDPAAAPADTNVKEYTLPAFWMELPAGPPVPTRIEGSALSHVMDNRLVTIAEERFKVPLTGQASYGPLWAFSKPLRYQGATPASPGTKFLKSSWSSLYPVDAGTVKTNATAPGDNDVMPYDSTLPAFRTAPGAPSAPGLRGRRILNIPLLSCPVTGGTATVLAVGRFLMTSRATSSPGAVFGEFGGLATPANLVSTTVLFR
ncbi:hypothetical protein F2P45_25405 [Massilia sp. CCM 8733]|uniref:Putative Flp pilus-assembly TadG-like N-terminal domain-containing protein n=1 Tax=Massilia mucilaginosa TaxID=2609282 RepID=A0ABX0NZI0_9BURK|nr:pilus assembly protein TadG-related protein [Massilia mucilaginosa]NHZ92317.1 hypothetical protein [Massilia mucilaginosa]